jgi:hypothetical protein
MKPTINHFQIINLAKSRALFRWWWREEMKKPKKTEDKTKYESA